MLTNSQKANSRTRVAILSNEQIWSRFNRYFELKWQAREIWEKLAEAGVWTSLVYEWSIWTFHELAKEEATWKRERGEGFKNAQRMIIEACDRTMPAYRWYTDLPPYVPDLEIVNATFSRAIEENTIQREQAQQLLDRAENTAIFKPRRLGTNWNGLYLKLLKEYIWFKTGWDNTTTIGAVTHLVAAAHQALERRRAPDLRRLLQKALCHFEEHPDNGTINYLVTCVVRDSRELANQFPIVVLHSVG